MEKIILTAQVNNEQYEYKHEVRIGDEIIHVRAVLNRREREEMALEQAGAVLVFDEEAGLVYEGYNRDLADMVCMLKWYTDIDLTPYDSVDGRYALYDLLASHGVLEEIRQIVNADLSEVQCIYFDLHTAAKRTFEQKYSINHLLKATLSAILGSEDIATTFAKAQEINGSLIDMMGALKREQENTPGGGLLSFAKKE